MKQGKQNRKKKYSSFYLKRLCIFAAVIFLIAGCRIKRQWEDVKENVRDSSTWNNRFEGDHSALQEQLDRIQTDADIPLRLAAIAENTGSAYPVDTGVMLYQPETGEHYIGEPLAFASVTENGNNKRYWLSDQTLVDQLDSAGGLYYKDPIVYSIYVKDDQFVPGEVYFQKRSYLHLAYFDEGGDPIKGEWVDLTPENTEGWTKITSDQSKELLIRPSYESDGDAPAETDGPYVSYVVVIGSPNAPLIDVMMDALRDNYQDEYEQEKEFCDRSRERLREQLAAEPTQEDFEALGADITDAKEYRREIERRLADMDDYMVQTPCRIMGSPEMYSYYTRLENWENVRYATKAVTFRGESWQIFHCEYVNAKEYFKRYYLLYDLIELAICLLLVLIVPPVWALIAYLIYRRRYDLEAYRRNLTGALAHDLKTPLAVISGFAENLRTHTHPEKTDAYADGIMKNVQHIDEMITGVLGLAQLERSECPEMKEEVDVTALLHAAFERNALAMEQRGLTLAESGTWSVKGNAGMLTQLADNLAANAVQHAEGGSEITVTAAGDTLRISNRFEGELDVKTLYEPFQRGSAARGKQSGSGLGLSIVQQIAALHRLKFQITAENGIFTAALRKRKGM